MSLFSDMKYFTSAELRLEVVEDLFQCIDRQIHFPQNTIHSKNVVDIVESGQRCRNPGRSRAEAPSIGRTFMSRVEVPVVERIWRSSLRFLYVKRQYRRQPDIGSIIGDRRSLKAAGRAAVDAELAEMLEIILQRRAAVLTETAFADLP